MEVEGKQFPNFIIFFFIIELTYINGNALRRYMLFIVAKVLFYILY